MPTTYEDLYERDKTIYKKGVEGGLDTPYARHEDLAGELGVGVGEIDWGAISPYQAPQAPQIPRGWDAETYANFKRANPDLEPTEEDTRRMQHAGATAEDILGSDAYDEELDIAEKGYYKTLTPEYRQELRGQSDIDIMKRYQQEIDALEAERVAARGRITSQYGQIGEARAGTSTAIQARRGLVGSTFGTQQKREVATQTQREQEAALAYSSAQYSERKRAIMGDVRTAQADEAKLRLEAAQLGSQAKIEEIRGRKTRQDERISNTIKNLLGMNADTEDEELMAEVAEGLGISVKDLMSKYETSRKEAEELVRTEELERRKLEAEGQTIMKPGELLYDSEGNLIAEGTKEAGKTITLKPGEVVVDAEGNVIAQGLEEEYETQVVELSDGSKILINKDTGETIKRFEEDIDDIQKEGIYSDEIEFGYNEKIDISKIPKLGGKQITNKTARGANLPYGITDKQADWIIDHRIGNIQFQQLKSKDVDNLNDLIELREDIEEIREIKNKIDTGKVRAPIGRTLRDWFGKENKDFNRLEIKTGKSLAEYIKEISGAAVSEQEAQRLARLVPNIEMQDGQFVTALDDLEDGLDGLIRTKISQFDLDDEEQMINAIRGITEEQPSSDIWSEDGESGGLWDFNGVGGDTNKATLNVLSDKKEGTSGGQCGRFVNKIAGLGVGDSYNSKMAKMDKSIKTPKAGMVFLMPYKKTGHCGFITSIKNGIATVKDSNWSLDSKIKTHTIPVDKMTGFAYNRLT